MRMKSLCLLAGLFAASFASPARADLVNLAFSGSGVSGSLELTYGATTDARYSDAYAITGIRGTFSNATLGIVDAEILSLVAITRDTPHATNLLAPNDFSRFAVASGIDHGSLSYDNLFWPGGSPQTATDYPFFGGFFDIYGLLFNIEGGMVVNLWSYGDTPAPGPVDYGVAVVTPDLLLDYVDGVSVRAVPEPGTFALLGMGLVGVLARRRARVSARS